MSERNVINTLGEVPLLSACSKAQLTELATRMTRRHYKKDSNLMEEGSEGDEFFILATGNCSVIVKQANESEPKCIATLHAGDYCGEQALLDNNPRNATIRANSDVTVLVVTRAVFQTLIQNDFGITFAKRKAICANYAESKQSSEPENVTKSPIERKWIFYTVSGNILFAELTTAQKRAVIDCMYKKTIRLGECVINEGDLNGDLFYVIREGKFEISKKKEGLIKLLCPGDCCGELALLYGAPRAATVKCSSTDGGVVWCLHRSDLHKAIVNETNKESKQHIKFLKKVPLLSSLLSTEIVHINDALEQEIFNKNDIIIKQGDVGNKFYIIEEGQAKVIKDEDESKQVGLLSNGDYFGERSLIKNDKRAATIIADSAQLILLSLTREKFNDLLGSLEDLMQRNMKEYKRNLKLMIQLRRQKSKERRSNMKFSASVKDLKVIGILGRGGYGLVKLVSDPINNKSFALKEVRKEKVIKSSQIKHINDERKLMLEMDSPFLVRLWRTYQDDYKVYFVLDACLGGDLFTILRKSHSFKEHVAKFYAGCVIEGFEHLHSMNMAYRDLKPENLVLNSDGYLKITDFGFCKVLDDECGKTFTLCGTPDYLAPEIILGRGHDLGVDFWTLGILLYEMLASMPPFYDRHATNIYRKAVRTEPIYPAYFSSSAKDLIRKLLKKRPTQRLGCTVGGIKSIKRHSWFKGFDWVKLQKQELRVPYKPKVKSQIDISNFRCKNIKQLPLRKIHDQTPFKDF